MTGGRPNGAVNASASFAARRVSQSPSYKSRVKSVIVGKGISGDEDDMIGGSCGGEGGACIRLLCRGGKVSVSYRFLGCCGMKRKRERELVNVSGSFRLNPFVGKLKYRLATDMDVTLTKTVLPTAFLHLAIILKKSRKSISSPCRLS